jgi:Sec-independent protein secretion pathway component TatC
MLYIKTFLQLHYIELKYNIIVSIITFFYLFFICCSFSNQLIFLFIKIILKYNFFNYFIFTNILDFFFINIIISFIISFFIFIFILIIQYWFYIASGLFKYENLYFIKNYLFLLLFSFKINFLILFNILPNILFFFINYNKQIENNLFNMFFEPNIQNFLTFIFLYYICIYIIFIYFYILINIIFYKIIKINIFINLRKIFYLKFIIITNIILPTDFLNQLFFVLLFIIFYEILIFIYLFLYRYFFYKR